MLEAHLVGALSTGFVIWHVTAVLQREKSLRPSVTKATMQLCIAFLTDNARITMFVLSFVKQFGDEGLTKEHTDAENPC